MAHFGSGQFGAGQFAGTHLAGVPVPNLTDIHSMATLVSTLMASISGPYSRPRGLGVVSYQIAINYTTTLNSGTLSGQAETAYVSQNRQVDPSTFEILELSGPLIDAIGDPLGLVTVKGFCIHAAATNANDIVIGNAATNPWLGWFGVGTQTEKIPPDGTLFRTHPTTGWPVVNGSNEQLKIANGGAGTPVLYDIVIVGTSS